VKVLVVGAGAVGSLLAATLAIGGVEVTIVRRGRSAGRDGTDEGDRGSEAIAVVRPDAVRQVVRVGVVDDPARLEAPPDVVLFAVKGFDLEAALAGLPEWPSTARLTVQNGVGGEELAATTHPAAPLIAGSLTASVELGADRVVHWRRTGGIGLAAVRGDVGGPVDRLVTAWSAGGLPARRYPDWAAMKWSKLLANLVANATTALLDSDPAAVYGDRRLFEVERAQLREALAVMQRRALTPVALPGAPVPWLARSVALPGWLVRPVLRRIVGGARGGKSPSLRLHLAARGGASEVAWLNGGVAREGDRLGVRTPVNAALAGLVAAAATDPALRDRLRGSPERLLDALGSPPIAAGTIGVTGPD